MNSELLYKALVYAYNEAAKDTELFYDNGRLVDDVPDYILTEDEVEQFGQYLVDTYPQFDINEQCTTVRMRRNNK